jgi:hypothetical protein
MEEQQPTAETVVPIAPASPAPVKEVPVAAPVVKQEPPKPAPKTFTPEEISQAEKIVTQPYYRLKLRTPAGMIRGDINKEVIRQLSIKWGDLLRVIPQHRWSTFEEILQTVWEFENRSVRKLYTRTRKQVEDGVADLLACGVLEKKN